MSFSHNLFLIRPENASCFSALLTEEASAALTDPTTLTIGVAHNNLACGAVCVDFDTAVGDILSLFIARSQRRHGAARTLLNGLIASAKRMGVKRLQIVCETAAIPAMEEFLAAAGFLRTQTLPRFRITLEQLSKMALPEVSLQHILPMGELPRLAKKAYNQLVQENPEHLLYLDTDALLPDLSAFCLAPDNTLGGFTALAERADGLELINTYCAPRCIRQLPALFRFSLQAARAAYPPETMVLMDAVTPESERLLRHLLENLDWQESVVDTFVLPL